MISHATNFWFITNKLRKILHNTPVNATIPLSKVMTNMNRSTISEVVLFEIVFITVENLLIHTLTLFICQIWFTGAGTVEVQPVIIHSESLLLSSGDLDLRQMEVPATPNLFLWPVIRRRSF